MEYFKTRLKEIRNERGITLKNISEYLGISVRAYQYYESGDRYPDFKGLVALADYLDVSIDYLTGRTDTK